MALAMDRIRQDIPILKETFDGNPLVYLDNAATTQKPRAVLDAMTRFYETDNANAHRGMHVLAERATIALEDSRRTVQTFLHAAHPEEIVFTKSCTESINLVARGLSQAWIDADAIILSILEHHSNIVPWLQVKEERGCDLLWIDIHDDGTLNMQGFEEVLRHGTVKLVAITAQSNVLGIRPPLKEMIQKAHAAGALVLVDAAQAMAHEKIDVTELDCDFLTFSGHKLYGPTGIGVLYGKRKLLETLPPLLGGGMMIGEVFTDRFTTADVPAKFEGGTQPLAEAVGLDAAIDWLTQFSWDDITKHESLLMKKAYDLLQKIPGLTILCPNPNPNPSPLLSFTIDGVHPHDLTEILGRKGICLRAGHHCTQPLHRRLGIPASTRLSVGIYNTTTELDLLAKELPEAVKRLQ
ncbi:hypothetical protein A3D88_01360 [Candidatus Peribacteria bacterium RIFCSPHIGHO2_02_FULL_52_16]|nr:MAG: hypothetical protein A2706_03600 [Candidatus Peribacteria bacterium RIFCSPHIGHO2_01_FULL_51_35]OGJ60967.1 MAG: hypothetical protein A3D88_01360 [Candidatus Peribacteria bacterium RIFCSPHIGHO2_02_FULL_52_16]